MNTAYRYLLCILLLGQCSLAFTEEDAELAALMALLQEETQLATKTRMNADFVPGSVTVLHGEELQKFGFHRVGDALDMVAGVLVSRDNLGGSVTTVRGVGASLNSSNIKVLLNGVALNNNTDGSADAVLNIPITQLDRMEVIRGPGSAVYGEFAFTGVVNFITHQDANQAAVIAGSHNSREYNLLTSGKQGEDLHWNLNLSRWTQDDSGRSTGLDDFAYFGNGYAPGDVYDNNEGWAIIAGLNIRGYHLKLHYLDYERGSEFGGTAVTPQEMAPRTEKLISLNLDKTWEWTQDLDLRLSLNTQQRDYKSAETLPIPAGVDPPGPAPVILVDRFTRNGAEDSSYRLDSQLIWQGLADHNLLLGVSFEHLQVDDSFRYSLVLGEAPVYLEDGTHKVLPGAERDVISTTLQDQWQILDNLDITYGVRYDAYDDAGTNVSPRIAAVWRASDRHLFKAQYAEAFRPPTLQETYPGPDSSPGGVTSDLVAEELHSTEVSYIYRQPGMTLRSTLFNTQVSDLIEFYLNPGDPPIWRNRGKIESNGVELEWQQSIGREWTVFSNLSYSETEDKLEQDRLTGSVPWLANLGVNWDINPHHCHSIRVRYVGTQQGWEYNQNTDNTTQFAPYTTVNYSWTWQHPGDMQGLRLQAGINNLLDEDYQMAPNPNLLPEGLTQDGRTFWLGMRYDFSDQPF